MEYDNPAGRLLAILEEAKKRPANTGCRKQWHEILKTTTEAQLMTALGKVMLLPDQAFDQLHQYYPAHQIRADHWRSQINSAFLHQQLQGHWETFIAHFDDHTINYLTQSSVMLELKSKAKIIDADELAKWKGQLNKIIEDILASEKPKELKLFLVKNLSRLVQAIDDYRLTGVMPLVEAMDATYGHCFFNTDYKDFLSKDQIGKRIVEAIQTISNVVTVATGYTQLAPPAIAAFLAIAASAAK